MNHETYENLLRVAEKRKRQATMRGNWTDCYATGMEIELLKKIFQEENHDTQN